MKTIRLTGDSSKDAAILEEISQVSGVSVERCYQCGKCTAGCPVAFAMDRVPREIMRLLQLGLVDEALKTKTIWLCASCDTCSTRCPRQVDIAQVMESLRIKAKKMGYINEKRINLFHELFLKSVENNGRVYEMGLVIGRNLLGMRPLEDAQLGPSMFVKGKLSLMPHKIKDNGEVKKIFANVRQREERP